MLTAEGDSWQVKICAVANGASATIAHLLDTGGDCSMRMVLAELRTIDAHKTADGWKWSTVGDYSPPPLLDNEITTSTHAPFSEKLMTFHAGAMFKVAITYYATAMTTSMRLDIVGHCEACILRDLKVAGRCSEVMIKNGWIEKPPEASDRKEV